MRCLRTMVFVVVVLGCGVLRGWASTELKTPPASEPLRILQAEQQRMQAESRQKKMLDDTQRLLTLAQQLKDTVDKTNKDTLSVEVLKQAEQIERLAKSVREQMKN